MVIRFGAGRGVLVLFSGYFLLRLGLRIVFYVFYFFVYSFCGFFFRRGKRVVRGVGGYV